jgi:hypothetical protein
MRRILRSGLPPSESAASPVDRRLKGPGAGADTSRMADRRQPDYDFFGPGPAAQPPPPRPPQPYGVPAHGHAPGFAPAPGGLPPAPYLVPRRSRAVTALIVAAVVVGSLFVAGIVAAVALPVFLNQRIRAEWQATTVALPETFEGGARTAAPPDLQPQNPEGVPRMEVATYRTDAGVTVLAVAGKTGSPQRTEEQAENRRDLLAGLASEGVNLQETDAGALGGWLGCGRADGSPSTICVATDQASILSLLVTGADDPASVARRLREATVHR